MASQLSKLPNLQRTLSCIIPTPTGSQVCLKNLVPPQTYGDSMKMGLRSSVKLLSGHDHHMVRPLLFPPPREWLPGFSAPGSHKKHRLSHLPWVPACG